MTVRHAATINETVQVVRVVLYMCEIELYVQQDHGTNQIQFTAIVVCTVAWEPPLWTCVCAVVQGETRTNGRGTPHLLLRSRRKEPHEKGALETALTRVSNTEGIHMYYACYTSSAQFYFNHHPICRCLRWPSHSQTEENAS